jgi:hypothetical protein
MVNRWFLPLSRVRTTGSQGGQGAVFGIGVVFESFRNTRRKVPSPGRPVALVSGGR